MSPHLYPQHSFAYPLHAVYLAPNARIFHTNPTHMPFTAPGNTGRHTHHDIVHSKDDEYDDANQYHIANKLQEVVNVAVVAEEVATKVRRRCGGFNAGDGLGASDGLGAFAGAAGSNTGGG
jgi:hypothetical protein